MCFPDFDLFQAANFIYNVQRSPEPPQVRMYPLPANSSPRRAADRRIEVICGGISS